MNNVDVKNLIYLFTITFIAFAIQYFFYFIPNIHWLTWPILFAGLITSGNTVLERLTSIVVTGFATALLAFIVAQVAKLSGMLSGILAALLLLITIICILIHEVKHEYFYNTFLVNFFAILSVGFLQISDQSINEFWLIISGFSIIVLIQFVFSFNFIQNNLNNALVFTLKDLKVLNDEIFSCLLSAEYPDNKYLFERRLHLQKNKWMQSFQSLCKASTVAVTKLSNINKNILNSIIETIDQIFDTIIDCAQVRRRVSDYSVFEICKDELKAIALDIDMALSGLIKKNYHYEVSSLDQAIKKLEANYNAVLQVAAREPLVIFLFIESLKELSEKLKKIKELLLEFDDRKNVNDFHGE